MARENTKPAGNKTVNHEPCPRFDKPKDGDTGFNEVIRDNTLEKRKAVTGFGGGNPEFDSHLNMGGSV